MSNVVRVLKSGYCEITQGYNKEVHEAVDIVKEGYELDNIVAHSDGKIVSVIDDCQVNTNGMNGNILDMNNPGNMIKIDHGNGYSTRYLHLTYGSLKVKIGDEVKKGNIIGYMGNTGYSFGGHLHFEVLFNDKKIDLTKYLINDLPIKLDNEINNTTVYKIGDVVTIDGVYMSSVSDKKLKPTITKGTITKIIEGARNPYLLDNGKIGWINDESIVKDDFKYITNATYRGVSIVDALKQINVDSSYKFRSKLAKDNGINDYVGSAQQNTMLLDLLKKGILKLKK